MEPASSLPSISTPQRKPVVNFTEYDRDNQASPKYLSSTKKAKRTTATPKGKATKDKPEEPRKRKNRVTTDVLPLEKRLRRYRARAPGSYLKIKDRAITQRLTVLLRERCGTDELPEEKVVIAGSTGNIYTVKVRLIPSCDCPHAKKGNQCKHIIYIMLRVLKAREDIAFQLALTSTELRELIKNAPAIPGAETEHNGKRNNEKDGNRKPIEGECPICYDNLDTNNDDITYCKASCGNNVHKACMQSWIQVTAKRKATCPYCRAIWEKEEVFNGVINLQPEGLEKNSEGYLNVAGQLGLSGERDITTYHSFWVKRNLGRDL